MLPVTQPQDKDTTPHSHQSFEQDQEVDLTLLLRKPTKLRILKYLTTREFATPREVTDAVNNDGGPSLSYVCIVNNLKKLAEAKIVHRSKSLVIQQFPFRRLLDRIDPDDLKTKGFCSVWDVRE
jgi:hypothetical protein